MILLLCAMAAASVDGQEVTQSIRTVCVPKSSTVFYRVKEMVRMYQFSDTIRYGVLDYYIEDSDAMKTERYYRIIDSFKVKGRPYNGLSLKKIAASVDTARESPGDTVAYEHAVGVRCRMFTWQKDEHVFSCVYDTGSNSIVFLSSPRVHTSATATAWHWIALILIALFAARCGSWSVEQDGEDISFFSATVFFCVRRCHNRLVPDLLDAAPGHAAGLRVDRKRIRTGQHSYVFSELLVLWQKKERLTA